MDITENTQTPVLGNYALRIKILKFHTCLMLASYPTEWRYKPLPWLNNCQTCFTIKEIVD